MEPFIAYISDWLFHPALFSQFSNFCLPSSSPSLSCHFSDLPLHLLPQICNFLSFCSHISGGQTSIRLSTYFIHPRKAKCWCKLH
ncbi:hypothetical protein E1A91_D06G072200v1 [Gossypium mustelinum]|uniref:Uncharacterized protein n=1 Tax=Gossypium mustelinum TaxID=34275 RepID=A0A5D2UFF9_GOSMU|nr:hypothetical protein E1A91_D06G072200v1 [Gossypium mustelinum]TYI76379.1 hypothetical protein E1A91_D06G072200v1 [Gossypium mustelinum]